MAIRLRFPAGTFTWATGVTITKIITLQGQGTGTGGGDQTVIIDNYASGQRIIEFPSWFTSASRITGITVQSGSGAIKDGGTIKINGPGNVRIDHCHFIASSTANYKMVAFYSGVFGVMDHCILDFTGTNALYFFNGRQGVGIGWETSNGPSQRLSAAPIISSSRTTSSTGTWAAAHTALGFSMDLPQPGWSCDSMSVINRPG